MTYDDFLTLTLPERIAWLHSKDGPRGFLSHDDFAEVLGTSRQVVIDWEKPAGAEPKKFVDQLTAFSGFPSEAFLRRTAEAAVHEMFGRRLESLEEQAAGSRVVFRGVLGALAEAGIQVRLPPEAAEFLATPAADGRGSP